MTDDTQEIQMDALLSIPLDTSSETVALLTNYGTPAFYCGQLGDVKGRIKFIKDTVTTIRKCPEYARYRTFLMENLNMDRCSILSGLLPEEVTVAGLELHHAPLTLFDITELILGQMESEGARISTFAVSNRVMANHWKGNVGLVPLIKMLHEAVHAGQLHVDPRSIFGNWQKLLHENRAGITEHLADKIKAIAASWTSEEAAAQNKAALTMSVQSWTTIPVTRDILLGHTGANTEQGENQ